MKTAEDMINEKEGEIISVPSRTTIRDVLQIMAEHKIGAMLISEGEDIIGIWTERDLTRNVLEPGFDIDVALIGDYMITNLKKVDHTDTAYDLMDKFLGLRMRHLIVERYGRFIGLLSAGDVMKTGLQEKNEELSTLNRIVNWDYYEKWQY